MTTDAAAPAADAAASVEPEPLDAAAIPPCASGADCTVQGRAAADEKRFGEAHQLFERACELGDAAGCQSLALALQTGYEGVLPVDEVRSAQVMEKACTLGALESCWMLGNAYLYGSRLGAVAADPARAAKLYEVGCSGGEAASCSSLAQCYEDGRGVPANRATARKYHRRAKELGYVGE